MKIASLSSRLRARRVLAAAALAGLSGCASTRLDATWSDPQFAGTSLKGARVLVACEAPEPVVQRLCEDRMSAEVVARGATAVVAQELVNPTGDAYAPAARATRARAALVVAITTQVPPPTSSGLSIGIGGFGIGGGRVGGGVGVSVPVGTPTQGPSGYAANSRLIDGASGRLMWTARATTPPSGNLDNQLGELATATLAAAEKSGLF